jgi:hypothetical protein
VKVAGGGSSGVGSGGGGKGGSDDTIVGNLTRVKVAKNKLAPPFRTADFEMTYGHGISRTAEAVDLGVLTRTLSKSGAWYAFADAKLVDAVNAALAAQPVAAATTAPAPAAAAAAAAAAAPVAKPGKAKGGKAAAGATGPAAPEVKPAAAAAPEAAVPAARSAPVSVKLNEPFAQGRDKVRCVQRQRERDGDSLFASLQHT